MRSLWLAKKANNLVALKIVPNPAAKRVDFEIIRDAKAKDIGEGTAKRGSATCPCCGFTTPVTSVRTQLKTRRGGARDARLFAVVTTCNSEQSRRFQLPTNVDLDAVRCAANELERRQTNSLFDQDGHVLSLVPDEVISPNELRRISVPIHGMERWGDLFSPRQALSLSSLASLVRKMPIENTDLAIAAKTCLGLAVTRVADRCSSLGRYDPSAKMSGINNTFSRQLGMVWDFGEGPPISDRSGGWEQCLGWIIHVIDEIAISAPVVGHAERISATRHPLPDSAIPALVTDPPYYDAVPYAHLSDFFYVWLRRMLGNVHPQLFGTEQVQKEEEIVVDRPHKLSQSKKGVAFYERELQKSFSESRRVLRPDGIGIIVFASKTTSSWEAILRAVVDAGWLITGSWPIDTEMETRVAAQGQARLGSSVHLVCRPRTSKEIGDWRDVLTELPQRMHEWMPLQAKASWARMRSSPVSDRPWRFSPGSSALRRRMERQSRSVT